MKTRALLTIIISLITGIILGFLISGQITRLKTRDIRSTSSKESLKTRTYDMIKPTEEQKQKLDPIVKDYAELFDSMRQETHRGFLFLIDQYHNSLTPYLTEEQVTILDEFGKAMRHKKHPPDKKHKKRTHKDEKK
jgi:uncharacterized membrane-anchored protein YhcB (DUF1043 family)